MKKVGIFGSSFNPPHRGHARLVEVAQIFLELDEVLFVPTKIPPHKTLVELWGYETRVLLACVAFYLEGPEELALRMEKIALPEKKRSDFLSLYQKSYCPHEGWKLWEAERDRSGPSYTIDILRMYHDLFPENKMFLLIGQDQAAVFNTWKEYEKIFDLATVSVVTRPNADPILPLPFVILPSIHEDVSSTQLREDWLKGKPFNGWVSPEEKILLEALR